MVRRRASVGDGLQAVPATGRSEDRPLPGFGRRLHRTWPDRKEGEAFSRAAPLAW